MRTVVHMDRESGRVEDTGEGIGPGTASKGGACRRHDSELPVGANLLPIRRRRSDRVPRCCAKEHKKQQRSAHRRADHTTLRRPATHNSQRPPANANSKIAGSGTTTAIGVMEMKRWPPSICTRGLARIVAI